jgi:hypothetical protein
MVIAGIKIRKITGDKLKNGMRSASAPSRRFVLKESTQWNNPEAIK